MWDDEEDNEPLDKWEQFFEDYESEYGKFDRIINKRHHRPDIHAFLLISEVLPEDKGKIIRDAEHDQFYLDGDPETFFKRATEEQVIELIRCGVGYEADLESFYMYP